jgi:hypothetical protein
VRFIRRWIDVFAVRTELSTKYDAIHGLWAVGRSPWRFGEGFFFKKWHNECAKKNGTT